MPLFALHSGARGLAIGPVTVRSSADCGISAVDVVEALFLPKYSLSGSTSSERYDRRHARKMAQETVMQRRVDVAVLQDLTHSNLRGSSTLLIRSMEQLRGLLDSCASTCDGKGSVQVRIVHVIM